MGWTDRWLNNDSNDRIVGKSGHRLGTAVGQILPLSRRTCWFATQLDCRMVYYFLMFCFGTNASVCACVCAFVCVSVYT